jgi:uncharacterized protein YlxW (UPF0749 family)
LPVALVALLAGALLTVNATAQTDTDLRNAPGLRGMVQARDREVAELSAKRELLGEEVELAVRGMTGPIEGDDLELALLAGGVSVTGPGLTVTLDDAPSGGNGMGINAGLTSDLLVHQQDIDAVLNALRLGGAEALAVQGQRIGSNTAVKCAGNVILVAGRLSSPPYRISAIGPADALRAALNQEPQVQLYRSRADRLGLGWTVTEQDDLVFDGDAMAGASLRYARAASR